jgi:hypothetical protein
MKLPLFFISLWVKHCYLGNRLSRIYFLQVQFSLILSFRECLFPLCTRNYEATEVSHKAEALPTVWCRRETCQVLLPTFWCSRETCGAVERSLYLIISCGSAWFSEVEEECGWAGRSGGEAGGRLPAGLNLSHLPKGLRKTVEKQSYCHFFTCLLLLYQKLKKGTEQLQGEQGFLPFFRYLMNMFWDFLVDPLKYICGPLWGSLG